MKKKTVITAEKHEVWVVREVHESTEDQALNINKAISVPKASGDLHESNDSDDEEAR